MLTKYKLTIGTAVHEVPDECLANWDEISFSLKRTDYSGVMRSYSTQFVFVGAIRDLLWAEYLANGFLASASIAVHTITNTHEWEQQFEAPLDFSSIEIEDGKLTINAIDNTLAALIKSKKGQKYQFPVSEFDLINVQLGRLSFANSQKYKFPRTNNPSGNVDVRMDDANSVVISTAYVEPADESTGYDGTENNRFFAKINTAPSPIIRIAFEGYVNYRLDVVRDDSVATLQLGKWVDGSNPHYQLLSNLCDNDITKELRYGSVRNKWIGKSTHANYVNLDALKAAARSGTDILGLYPGYFGIVGSNAYPNDSYWTDNVVYEYTGSTWVSKGHPSNYNKYVQVSAYASIGALATNDYPMLRLDESMLIINGTLTMTWSDPAGAERITGCIAPTELLQRIVSSISPTATSSIEEDDAGLLADTYIAPAEALRGIPESRIFTTFQQFADWMEAVFGYTYRIVGNEVQFVHRSAVFDEDNVKVIERFRDVKYSVDDGIIYSEVNAGYSKKEYGEINGRLEKNFTNYYSTGYNATDKKLSLISKYRADSFGIESTIRKGEKENETKDDKSDEEVFFLCAIVESDVLKYKAANNDAYAPDVCVENNAGLIAAMGNGAAVTLEMTSSDGNNELSDIVIPAGTAFFSAGELEFTTDDMVEPAVLDGLVQLDHEGFRYTGFIGEVRARYGRENGFEYKLIVKEITAL